MKRSGTYNRIWLPAAILITLLLGLFSFKGLPVQAIALEQQARCGIEEHSHSDSCWNGSSLVCTTPVHSHTENCYLVLLKDNNINDLLVQVEAQPDNSLESLITQTVDNALLYNNNLTSPMAQEQTEPVDVAAINETTQTYDVQPRVTLNENLYKSTGSQDGELPQTSAALSVPTTITTETEDPLSPITSPSSFSLTAEDPLLQAGNAGTVAPLSLNDPVQTGSGKANYYVYLDGKWTTVGTMDFSTARSGYYYKAQETTSDIVTIYNQSLGTSMTANEMHFLYATSANAASYSWTAATQSGNYTVFGSSYSRQNTARAAKYVRLVEDNGDPMAFYTVTLIDLDGDSTVQYVHAGDSITLPEDSIWLDGNTEYAGGSELEIWSTLTLTAQYADDNLRISYNVSFPTVSGVTVSTKPVLLGTGETRLTDTVVPENSVRVRNVSQQEVMGSVDNNTVGLSRVIHFAGWQVEDTDVILSPNSTLTWAELQAYADGGRSISLTGVWESRALQTASFYVRYDSVAVDTEGNMTSQGSNLYTPELFAAYVGGEDAAERSVNELNNLYYIADTSSDNSYAADQAIRNLYGQQSGIWLQSFPADEDIFRQLRSYADQLKVDGEPVDVNDLNASAYTIRWYVFKCQSDAWHIDGRLVKKKGLLDVTKTFAGNEEAIAAAMEDFAIEAVNQSGSRQLWLCLTEPEELPEDTVTLVPLTQEGDTYHWTIEDVEYGELWDLRERGAEALPDDIVQHSDWRITDVYNTQNGAGSGTEVQVSGMTYDADIEIQALQVAFTNIYHTTDSIIIKKEDWSTGQPLGGAVFRLLQNEEPLRFTYEEDTDRYLYDPDGALTELTGNGYYELVVEGFSYDDGDVVVQELEAPEGYTPVEAITLGYNEDGEIAILSSTEMAQYDNGLLVVRNNTDSTSVTVTKQWYCPEEEWQPVTIQLLSNQLPVTALIPGVEPALVLDEENGWTATWEDLPRYANGQEIVWSVRETRVGQEPCLSDFTFVNWLVDYSPPSYTYDEEGRLVRTSFTVYNDTKRTLLRVIKINLGGSLRLADAEFLLEHLLPDGTEDPEFITRTLTTGADGTATFDNLKYGDYRLTEIRQPEGYYEMTLPIYLTIEQDGTVYVQEHPMALAGTTAYTIFVKNQPESPLPHTGGTGTGWYTALGIWLMLSALALLLSQYRRKGGAPPG